MTDNSDSWRFFHIVGGGCYGSQYVRWLLKARQKGWLSFQKLRIIDHQATPSSRNQNFPDELVEWVEEDWMDYLSQYLLKEQHTKAAEQDHWVPSPVTPHVLYLGFIKAATQIFPQLSFESEKLSPLNSIPVEINLVNGSLALSYAEWQCPINCIEPARCPAIHGPRDWDMRQSLQHHYAEAAEKISAHIMQCRHLVHGVGTIPCSEIIREFRRFLAMIEQAQLTRFVIATVSRCHGLLSQASIIQNRLSPQSKR